jgi:calcyclin binding protein
LFHDRLKISPLNKEIKPADCNFLAKSNSVTITLAKNNKENWDDVKEKAAPFKLGKKDKDVKEEADPQASMMNMMKEMYESGDDEMKKMIAQSWTKAQDETGKKKK